MLLVEQVTSYLQKYLPNFQQSKSKGKLLFTCPNIANHAFGSTSGDPTATFVPNSDRISCLVCGWKGTYADIIKLFEPDKANLTNEHIMEKIMTETKTKEMIELQQYEQYKWSLVPLAKNSKNPVEKDWTNKVHNEANEWIRWLENGHNIGVRTGEVSGITGIDVDLKIAPTEEVNNIIRLLNDTDTLTQHSPNGLHYIYKYDKDVVQSTKIGNLPIDIRNDGGQLVVQPSSINGTNYQWKNLGTEIKEMPIEVKEKILNLLNPKKADIGRKEQIIQNVHNTETKIEVIGEGNRNQTMISMGGVLIKMLPIEKVAPVMYFLNQTFFKPALPRHEIDAMIGSLDNYKQTEEVTQKQQVIDCVEMLKMDISPKEVMEHTSLKRQMVDKYIAELVKEGKLVRIGRGRYNHKEKIDWSDQFSHINDEYPHTMPYFDDIMHFNHGDIILLGGSTNTGKSTIALNIIKSMVEQGVKPYLINLESGSRFYKTAQTLGLKEGDFYHTFHANAMNIDIEPKSFTVIDWLFLGEDFAKTESILKHLNDEMEQKGGILVVFTQLKGREANYQWFAPNLIQNFPALAARYIYTDDSGQYGYWHLDKIKEPKGNYKTYRIECEYSFEKKLLVPKKII